VQQEKLKLQKNSVWPLWFLSVPQLWRHASAKRLLGVYCLTTDSAVVGPLSKRLWHRRLRICRTADERLFNQILSNETHTLNNLLPPSSAASQHYNLRQRRHNLELSNKIFHLIDNNFIQRMLTRIGIIIVNFSLWTVLHPASNLHFISFVYIVLSTFFMYFRPTSCILLCFVSIE